MRLVVLLSVFVLYSCSSSKNSENDNSYGSGSSVPKWAYAPMENCTKSKEICASASGDSIEEADLNAKKSLASVFETKITSNFEVNTTSISQQGKDELAEQVYSQVNESIDQVLKAVTIKKRYHQTGESYFSLASLDTRKAAKTIRLELKNIDDQLDFLYQEGKRTSIRKMLLLFDKRQLLHERLILLNKGAMTSKYTFGQISNLRYKSPSRINISYDESVPKSITKWFANLMNDAGFTIVESSTINYKVQMGFVASEEFLKVKGFKKFQFTTTGEAKNKFGDTVGTFSLSLIGVGRNKKDAFQKIRDKMLKQIEQNIDKLNME